MRMSRSLLALALALVLVVPPVSALAATIQVARDGSGEYSVVFDAVAAAAAGDTILIAPGVYPEVKPFVAPGGQGEAVAWLETAELTIIGAGRGLVTLGPESPAPDLETGPLGVFCSATGNVRMRGVTVRNTASGVWGNDVWMDVEDCEFMGNFNGVTGTLSGFASVRNCSFANSTDYGIMLFGNRGATGALVEDCSFTDNLGGVDFQPPNCILRDCSFTGGIVGMQVSLGGAVEVSRCTFDGMLNVGVTVHSSSQCFLSDSVFEPTMAGNVSVSGFLFASGNQFRGGTYATMLLTYSAIVQVNNNHLFNNGGYTVYASDGGSPPIRTHDFTGNYWGTHDPAQVEAWVYHQPDAPAINYITIQYAPIAEGPVSTEETSIGRIKARYKD